MLIIDQKNTSATDIAIEFLNQGKVICFATDTVYGLAVDATNYQAVENLYKLKNRDKNKPIAIFVADKDQAKKFFRIDKVANKVIDKYMPGAITLILETTDLARQILAKNLNNQHNNFIGFRIIDSYFVTKLFKKYKGILAVTSANKSSEEPCSSSSSVKKSLKNLDLLICGKKTSKISSTVIKIFDGELSIIRQRKLMKEIKFSE